MKCAVVLAVVLPVLCCTRREYVSVPTPPVYVTVDPCALSAPPPSPTATTCVDPFDLAPGSCVRMNEARRLDHQRALSTWASITWAVCGGTR